MAGTVTEFLVSQARPLDASTLPDEVVEVARQCLLDWFAVTIPGAREPLVLKLLEEARRQGGHPVATIIGHGIRTSTAFASLVNGSAADAADFSDAHLTLHGHPSAAVIATALAVAEERGATGAQLLSAIVAGIELECRVGRLVNPEAYERTGFHPTGTLVHFGAAAAAAHLTGLSEAEWGYALGIAATQAAGLKASAGTMCKPMHCGYAAMHGVLAAALAKSGFVSNPDAIDAPGGFAATHSPALHREELFDTRGRFLILDIRVKQHATCVLTHSTIENMLTLKPQVNAAHVRRLELEVPAGHLAIVGKRAPKTELEAKFSLWATAAMALLGDDPSDLHAFTDERLHRAELRAMMERIEVRERPDLDFSVAHAHAELADGRQISSTADTSQPVRDLVLRRSQVSKKFHALLDPLLGGKTAGELERAIMSVERLPSVKPLIETSLRR